MTSSPTTSPTPLPAPPSREAIWARVGEERKKIYELVRAILDDLETAAPWGDLYYPPSGPRKFLEMEAALVATIDDIPRRVDLLAAQISDEATRDSLEFYFQGIHMSVASELSKLASRLEALRAAGEDADPGPQERAFTCEISADLKGKYTSSIMGAAASLIGEGVWRGVEIEPVLFPEKVEEFERNEKLVETLGEVIGNIKTLFAEVPLVDLVGEWAVGRRVDHYALTPLYSFLGNLGKLMQGSSRRSLYSGDYHQIQRRERLLSSRVSKLTALHDRTWHAADAAELEGIYPEMIRKATELAAILDVEVLKEIIGAEAVHELRAIVTAEGESGKRPGRRDRKTIPETFHSLIPLLVEEDLKSYLDLLLGSVLKRASLVLTRTRERTGGAPASEAAPAPAAGASERSTDEQIAALEQLDASLRRLTSRSNAQRKSFELIHRFLKERRSVPASMLRSIERYLKELDRGLMPLLTDGAAVGAMFVSHGADLAEHCRSLSGREFSPKELRGEVPATMTRLLELLDDLGAATASTLEMLAARK